MENEIRRYYDLRKEIEKYDDYYYNKSKSLISDYEYDQLRKEMESLEEKYPHLGEYARKNVGAKLALNRFPKVEHKYVMTSLKNTYNPQELVDWMNDTWYLCEKHNGYCGEKPDVKELYHIEWKFDGLSISLKYDKTGTLIQALTRGDGEYGEDVTENIYEIASVPKTIKYDITSPLFKYIYEALEQDGWIEVRGEILMSFEEFNRINAIRKEQGEELYANPRNLASGTLRNLDKSIFSDRELLFAPYHLENVWFNMDYVPFLKEFKKMGFKPYDNIITTFAYPTKEYTIQDVNFILAMFAAGTDRMIFNNQTIPIDGLVIKTQKYYYDQLRFMGDMSARYPKGAVAYKFEPAKYNTKLVDVIFQVGRTGKITPVAELLPVVIDGSTISRCTLHNFDEIDRLSLRKNCYVDIIKSAAVIPKIIGRQSTIQSDEEIIKIPTNCPVCGSPLIRVTGVDGAASVDLYCSNPVCPDVIKQQALYHFNVLKVKGFGPALYDAFKTAYKIHKHIEMDTYLYIYMICFSWNDILNTVRELSGCKVVQNFIDSLKHELEHPIFHRQLASIGLEGIGIQTAKDIEKKSKGYSDFIENYTTYNLPENVTKYLSVAISTKTSLVNMAKELINYLDVMKYKFLDNSNGSQPKEYVCSAVITGTFDFGSRDQIAKFLDENDIKVQSSVSRSTDVLVAGRNAGSKLDKAKELGVITIYPTSYEDLINQIHAAQK